MAAEQKIQYFLHYAFKTSIPEPIQKRKLGEGESMEQVVGNPFNRDPKSRFLPFYYDYASSFLQYVIWAAGPNAFKAPIP